MDNLVSLLAASARDHRSRPLFGTRDEQGWRWLSYGEFAARVDMLRGGLASLGVGPGTRVAVISRNRVEWAVACFATLGLGAAYVPMYEAQSAREWRHILADSGAEVCFVSGGAVGPRVVAAAEGLERLRHVVDFDAPGTDPHGYLELMEYGALHPSPTSSPAGSELAEIIYTSGTTGTPKGVCLTHANITSNIEAVLRLLPVSPDDRTLSFLPWAHVFGGDELFGVVALGASMAICESVDRLASELPEVGPTLLFSVPRVYAHLYQGVMQTLAGKPELVRGIVARALRTKKRLRNAERVTLRDRVAELLADILVFRRVRARLGGRLRIAVSAAAALAPEIAEFVDALGVVLLEAYGLTESSACATINRPLDRRIGSVGKAIDGVSVVLDRNVDGAEGGSGEILVYGHAVMRGYHDMPEETARVITKDGGLRTGDLGRFDEDGFLYVTGRLKELYKLENGKYVAPALLEDQLILSPFIDQAFVHGADRPFNVALLVPSRQALVAWARERGLETVSVAKLLADPGVRELFRSELARLGAGFRGFERIRTFELLEEPFSGENGMLTPTLKVKRRKVLARYGALLESLYAGRDAGDFGGASPRISPARNEEAARSTLRTMTSERPPGT